MRTGGANATNSAAYALGREMRRLRVGRALPPEELKAAIARNKLDALELGELGDPLSKKRTGHLSRAEAIALFLFPDLAIPTDKADALLVLAHDAGAMSPAEVYEPIGPAELRAHGREPAQSVGRRERISAEVDALLAAHPFSGPTRRLGAPSHPSPVWELPARRCSLFVGRGEELAPLRRAILSPGPGVIAVSGPAGSGKSELVRAAVDDPGVRQRFHACVWIVAREHEFLGRAPVAPTSPVDALAEIASHLAIAPGRLAEVLATARILVVVDNAEALADEDGVISRLGRMVGESKVIVTSRNRSAASFVLPFPPRGPLQGLRTREAVTLLQHEIAARGGARRDRRSLDRVAELVGGAPLALHWIAGRTPAEPLPELTRALETGGARELYEFMFGRTWTQLPTGARRVMRVLAYETVDPVAPQLLTELDRSCSPHAAVAALLDASMVEAAGPATAVGLHPLARSFVRSRTRAPAGPDRRSVKALEYLVRSLADDSRGSGAAEPLGGLRNYLRWMEVTLRFDPVLVMIAWTKLSRYLWEHWQWHLYEECTRVGAAAAREIGRTKRAAGALLRALTELDLTYLRFEQGRLDEALEVGERARAVFEELGDDAGSCLIHRYLGVVLMEVGDARSMAAARRSFDRALAAIARARREGYPRRSARIHGAVAQLQRAGLWETIRGGYNAYRGVWAPSEAELQTLLGDHAVRTGNGPRAVRILENAVRLYETADGRWPGSEGAPMIALGSCYEKLGRAADAERMYERVQAIAKAAERRDLLGAVLLSLARLGAERSPQQAAAQARDAKAIFEQLGQAKNATEADALIGRLAATSS